MSKLIRVQSCITNDDFDSLLEATSAAANSNESNQAKIDSIGGAIVAACEYNGTNLIISFENGLYLMVNPGDGSIEWDITSTKPEITNKTIEKDIFFEFPGGDKIPWDTASLLADFIGKQVAISASEQHLFIFARGGEEYLFEGLIESDNPQNRYLILAEV